MSRILVFHPKPEQVGLQIERLRKDGHEVRESWPAGPPDLAAVLRDPPDAFLIDLGRQPSHGQALATVLRQRKATRAVPIVFIQGDGTKTARVQAALPDAGFTTWRGVRGAVRAVLRRAPRMPVVPDTMAAYSGRPLPRKLGIKAGSVVALLAAPKGFEATIGPLPDGARLRRGARGVANIVLVFVRSRADLGRRFPQAKRILGQPGALWVVWPKRTSGLKADVGANEVRAFGLARGLVDYKITAVDTTWSGLCFARPRRGPRPGGSRERL
jgi:CheY-like chemotaxis protein